MNTADMVAVYAACLSTLLAAGQAIAALRLRAKIAVEASLMYSSSDSGGTPVRIRRGEDASQEFVTLSFTIRNRGGRAVQVLGVLIEELRGDVLRTSQIVPRGLPVVLDPATTIEVQCQKEHLDLLDSCTFLGVVDGTGRRHPVSSAQAMDVIHSAWLLPTRVAVYQRRDDPTKQVVAFQIADPGKITNRPSRRRWKGRPQVIARRDRPLIETLQTGAQPGVVPIPTDGEQ